MSFLEDSTLDLVRSDNIRNPVALRYTILVFIIIIIIIIVITEIFRVA